MSTCQEYLTVKQIRSYKGLEGAIKHSLSSWAAWACCRLASNRLVSIFSTFLTMKSAVRNSAKLCREAMGDEGGCMGFVLNHWDEMRDWKINPFF